MRFFTTRCQSTVGFTKANSYTFFYIVKTDGLRRRQVWSSEGYWKGRQRTITRDRGGYKTNSCQKAADHHEELHVEYDADC
jgi:hypothetical protein